MGAGVTSGLLIAAGSLVVFYGMASTDEVALWVGSLALCWVCLRAARQHQTSAPDHIYDSPSSGSTELGEVVLLCLSNVVLLDM